ncbi:MAG: hypothetical protein ACRCUZ_06890 [Shewanella sp.]
MANTLARKLTPHATPDYVLRANLTYATIIGLCPHPKKIPQLHATFRGEDNCLNRLKNLC